MRMIDTLARRKKKEDEENPGTLICLIGKEKERKRERIGALRNQQG